MAKSYEHGSEAFGFVKGREFINNLKRLLAFQKVAAVKHPVLICGHKDYGGN